MFRSRTRRGRASSAEEGGPALFAENLNRDERQVEKQENLSSAGRPFRARLLMSNGVVQVAKHGLTAKLIPANM